MEYRQMIEDEREEAKQEVIKKCPQPWNQREKIVHAAGSHMIKAVKLHSCP